MVNRLRVWVGSRDAGLAAFPVFFTLAALLVQFHAGAYATDRGQTSDEAAHFVTSLMLSDYLRHLGNPVAFAKSYYVHLPRVAIGHWPPFFEIVQSLAFDIFGGSNAVALALQAAIAGLLAGLPAALMARQAGLLAGALTGLIILCNRYILFQIDTVMADNLLGLLVFLTAWSWSWYVRQRSTQAAIAFAAATTAAILTKGTAIGLLLLPVVDAGLRRDWRFLLARRTLLALAAILLLTVPWYAATYRMAASGWNYSWGGFTLLAIPFFSKAFVQDFGVAGTAGFLYGAARVLRRRQTATSGIAVFALAAIVQFGFVLLVPADLQGRYLVPVYPCAAMLAVSGFLEFFTSVLPGRAAVASALTVLLAGLSIWQGFQPPHVESFRTQEAFAQIAGARGANPLILVSGGSRFEGAMIATVAAADRGRFFYALRASKLLSSSSFMGNGYAQRFNSAPEMRDWLVHGQIGWIIIEDSGEAMRYGHNVMLMDVAAHDPQTFQPVWHGMRQGESITLFQTPAFRAAPQHMDALLAQQAPSGVP